MGIRQFALAAVICWALGCSATGLAQEAESAADDEPQKFAQLDSGATPEDRAEYRDEAARCFPGDEEEQRLYAPGLISLSKRNACRSTLGLSRITRGAGGAQVDIASVPFQVQIRYAAEAEKGHFSRAKGRRWNWWEIRHICGGSLIGRDWVLTAAHCFNNVRGTRELWPMIEVVAKTSNIASESGIAMRADRIVINDNFDPDHFFDQDIALVHLAPAATSRDFRSADFAILDDDRKVQARPADEELRANGWGKATDGREQPVAVLQQFYMSQKADCASLPGYQGRVHDRVLCALGRFVKTCEGDSGGPLFDRDGQGRAVVVGIVSWNMPQCNVQDWGKPGVYTRVSAYRTWITRAMRASGSGIVLVK